jgi:hypothetical protein
VNGGSFANKHPKEAEEEGSLDEYKRSAEKQMAERVSTSSAVKVVGICGRQSVETGSEMKTTGRK